MTSPKRAQLAALRRQLAVDAVFDTERRVLRLGAATIDAALPWEGLPCGALHEIRGQAMDGAATGFCAALLARFSAGAQSVLWVCENDDLYAPGLAALGLPLDRLIVVRARRSIEILWTLEEALRCRGLGAVLGEIRDIPTAAGRRLQLAARRSGVTALLLRQQTEAPPLTTAVTRWQVVAARSPSTEKEDVDPHWWVELVRCRGRIHTEEGYVERWLVEWRRETGDLCVVPDLRDRSDQPDARRMAR